MDTFYLITDDCTQCGACLPSCPVEAIHTGDGRYHIDWSTCIKCGACQPVCPVNAIVETLG